MKPKLLAVLHYSPPMHGASKVGDFIKNSEKLANEFECYYIKIKSSSSIDEIGQVNLKKLYLVLELFFRVMWALITFRPNVIYFTASTRGVAFYRDVILSILWKLYSKIMPVDIFYHYHTKGIDKFAMSSNRALKLTRFFLKNINLVILSPMLEDDFSNVQTYKKVYYLPNGVETDLDDSALDKILEKRYGNINTLNVLYLSNMIKSKGYFRVLELAEQTKEDPIHYHFAGGWQKDEDKEEFFDFIKEHNLEEKVTFHGFVNGEEKRELFSNAHLFIFPTRYENEAFPLSILEAFSYGLPVLVTDEGSIPFIVDPKSGIILKEDDSLLEGFKRLKEAFIDKETSLYCRKIYVEKYSLEQFERNLLSILSVEK